MSSNQAAAVIPRASQAGGRLGDGRRGPELAASLAYRFLFAIFPFGIFLPALASFVAQWAGLGDPTDEILAALGDNLPREVAAQVAPQLETVTRPRLPDATRPRAA